MDSPRGFETMTAEAQRRWVEDDFCQSPYQYASSNCVQRIQPRSQGQVDRRRLVAVEEERLSGFPSNYTKPCKSVTGNDAKSLERSRKSLLGNAWTLPQAAFWVRICILHLFSFDCANSYCTQFEPTRWIFLDECSTSFKEVFENLRLECPYRQFLLDRNEWNKFLLSWFRRN